MVDRHLIPEKLHIIMSFIKQVLHPGMALHIFRVGFYICDYTSEVYYEEAVLDEGCNAARTFHTMTGTQRKMDGVCRPFKFTSDLCLSLFIGVLIEKTL